MATKLPKGSRLSIVKTRGVEVGQYDLYDIRGLSLGKLELIVSLLHQHADAGSTIAEDIVASIKFSEDGQTVNGK